MKKKIFIFVFLAVIFPVFSFAKSFSVTRPTKTEIINAILDASAKTSVRPAVLYGLFGQETGYGTYLGKTENGWSNFCGSRSTEDCRNWQLYDCKDGYGNARHFDEILKSLGFVDGSGNADRSQIPISSTCAMGFTQFEPNTWWETLKGRGGVVYDPWNVRDSILMAAYYLQNIGADKSEILKEGEVIGSRDRIALQKYYCGGYYTRNECVWYANGVEAKARLAPVELLSAGLQNQLQILEERKGELREQLNLPPAPPVYKTPPPPAAPKPILIETLPGLPNGRVGEFYSVKLSVTKESEQNARWNIAGGELPPGIALGENGVISGIPASPGAWSFTARVIAQDNRSDTKPMAIVVEKSLVIATDTKLPSGRVGEFYSAKFSVTKESVQNVRWRVLSGQLPPGLSLDATGVMSGIPKINNVSNYYFVVEASGDGDRKQAKSFEIQISPPADINISNNESNYSGGLPYILKRKNGELFVTYNIGKTCYLGADIEACFADNSKEGLWGSISKDDGRTWSAPFFVHKYTASSPSFYYITEDPNGNLILLVEGLGQTSSELIALFSKDGRAWGDKRVVVSNDPRSFIAQSIPGSVLYGVDGYYYVSYWRPTSPPPSPGATLGFLPQYSPSNYGMFITRSRDFAAWEEPVRVLAGADMNYDPHLFSGSDGAIYLFSFSYIPKSDGSYGKRTLFIMESRDGKNWENVYKVDPAGSVMNVFDVGGKPVVMYYTDQGERYAFRSENGWSGPHNIPSPVYQSPSAVILGDGSVGFVHGGIHGGASYADLFFTNLGKLNLVSPVP